MSLHQQPNGQPRISWHEYYETGVLRPLAKLSCFSFGFFAGIFCIVHTNNILLKFAISIVVSAVAGQIFAIGHDCCHGSFTPNAKLNRLLGLVALTMSFHIYSQWLYWHNMVHHRFTNNGEVDFVWRPMSKGEYDVAGPVRQWFEHLSRHHTGIGLGIYYFIMIIVQKMIRPSAPSEYIPRRSLICDSSFFYAYHACMLAWLVSSGGLGLEIIMNILFGFVVPLVFISYAIGFVVYFNHTHPNIKWHDPDKKESYRRNQIESTLYLKFAGISALLLPSEVMNHVVHHLNTKVPLRELKRAQEKLALVSDIPIKTDIWSLSMHVNTMRMCKLYDFKNEEWTDFSGR
jgi:acyl-lipid omega-6 desaturase (Delta-12 desaturase)